MEVDGKPLDLRPTFVRLYPFFLRYKWAIHRSKNTQNRMTPQKTDFVYGSFCIAAGAVCVDPELTVNAEIRRVSDGVMIALIEDGVLDGARDFRIQVNMKPQVGGRVDLSLRMEVNMMGPRGGAICFFTYHGAEVTSYGGADPSDFDLKNETQFAQWLHEMIWNMQKHGAELSDPGQIDFAVVPQSAHAS
jgi:hypothetical protein